VVNLAGGFVWEMIEGGSLDNWDKMYRMNLRTAATSASAALPHLLKSGGAVVNVGAAAAANPGTGMAPYAASKAGIAALTMSLAEELRTRGVRVNAVLPTIIDTPTNRADMPDADTSAWVKPVSVARVIAFLISPDSGAITGASIPLSLAG
jgi:NAD(P)-dependent dehydrogenase (short-subunit alcohol dehydrogenase family)